MDRFTPRTWNQPMNMADIEEPELGNGHFGGYNKSRRISATEIDIKRTFFQLFTNKWSEWE